MQLWDFCSSTGPQWIWIDFCFWCSEHWLNTSFQKRLLLLNGFSWNERHLKTRTNEKLNTCMDRYYKRLVRITFQHMNIQLPWCLAQACKTANFNARNKLPHCFLKQSLGCWRFLQGKWVTLLWNLVCTDARCFLLVFQWAKTHKNHCHSSWRLTDGSTNVTHTSTRKHSQGRSVGQKQTQQCVFECLCAGRRCRPGSDRRENGREEKTKQNKTVRFCS